jgi:hypothetical protein
VSDFYLFNESILEKEGQERIPRWIRINGQFNALGKDTTGFVVEQGGLSEDGIHSNDLNQASELNRFSLEQ